MNKIRVLEIRLVNGAGPVKAFADVQVGDWSIHDWRVLKRDGQRAWVCPPQVSWRDQSGGVKYRTLLSIPGELKQVIEVEILSAWEKEKTKCETSKMNLPVSPLSAEQP